MAKQTGPTPTEVTVILKDDERTFRKKFLIYESFSMDVQNEFIRGLIQSAIEEFPGGQPDDVILKTSMVCR